MEAFLIASNFFRCIIFACIQGKVEMEDQRMERLLMERESKMLPEEELKTVVDVLRFGLFFSIFTTAEMGGREALAEVARIVEDLLSRYSVEFTVY